MTPELLAKIAPAILNHPEGPGAPEGWEVHEYEGWCRVIRLADISAPQPPGALQYGITRLDEATPIDIGAFMDRWARWLYREGLTLRLVPEVYGDESPDGWVWAGEGVKHDNEATDPDWHTAITRAVYAELGLDWEGVAGG